MKRIVYLHHTNELVLFFAVIFAISWLWRGVILALQLPFRSIGFMLEGWAMAGPCVAAVFVTVRHQRRHGVQRLLATALRWRFGLIWYIVALRSVFALSMVAAGLSRGGRPLEEPLFHWLRQEQQQLLARSMDDH